jgi:hypothetical protein
MKKVGDDGPAGARDWFAEGGHRWHTHYRDGRFREDVEVVSNDPALVCDGGGGSWSGAFPIWKPGHVVVVENEYGKEGCVRICRAEDCHATAATTMVRTAVIWFLPIVSHVWSALRA